MNLYLHKGNMPKRQYHGNKRSAKVHRSLLVSALAGATVGGVGGGTHIYMTRKPQTVVDFMNPRSKLSKAAEVLALMGTGAVAGVVLNPTIRRGTKAAQAVARRR